MLTGAIQEAAAGDQEAVLICKRLKSMVAAAAAAAAAAREGTFRRVNGRPVGRPVIYR
jgi:hypothetical protein